MAGVNKVILVGNLGKDPEIRYTAGGTQVANFSIATTDRFQKDGQAEERTEWHNIVAFGRLAEICGEYLRKGKQVYIEGRLQTRSWEDREGNKRYTTEIIAREMQMLGRRDEGGGGGYEGPRGGGSRRGGGSQGGGSQGGGSQGGGSQGGPPPPEDEGVFQDDDIPF